MRLCLNKVLVYKSALSQELNTTRLSCFLQSAMLNHTSSFLYTAVNIAQNREKTSYHLRFRHRHPFVSHQSLHLQYRNVTPITPKRWVALAQQSFYHREQTTHRAMLDNAQVADSLLCYVSSMSVFLLSRVLICQRKYNRWWRINQSTELRTYPLRGS